MPGTPDNLLTRYPAHAVLVWGLAPAALTAGALAAAGTMVSAVPERAALTGLLAAACVALSCGVGIAACRALGASDRGGMAFLAVGASLGRKLVLLTTAAGAQFLLHPAAVPFWLSIVVGFVIFSIAEIRLLRPVLADGDPPSTTPQHP
jgi:hypothetical protein